MTDTVFLFAPGEPEPLRGLGTADAHIEARWGCDFAVVRRGELVLAVQRKAARDLLASRYDGRLARQLRLLQAAPIAVLLIEGHPAWHPTTGVWAGAGAGWGPAWRRADWWTAIDAVQEAGLRLVEVNDRAESAWWLEWQFHRVASGVLQPPSRGPPDAAAAGSEAWLTSVSMIGVVGVPFYRTKRRSNVFHEAGRHCGRRPEILAANLEVFATAHAAAATRRGWRRGCKVCRPVAEAVLECACCRRRVKRDACDADQRVCACGGTLRLVHWNG